MEQIPAPKKLYRPIVSVVAALSYRNDSFDLSQAIQHNPALQK